MMAFEKWKSKLPNRNRIFCKHIRGKIKHSFDTQLQNAIKMRNKSLENILISCDVHSSIYFLYFYSPYSFFFSVSFYYYSMFTFPYDSYSLSYLFSTSCFTPAVLVDYSPALLLGSSAGASTASTSGAFFQYFINPFLSSSFLYSSMVIKHFTDFSLIVLTCGAILAKPTFFHTSLSFLSKDLWMMFWISFVFFGFIHMFTSSWESMTGMRWWTLANYGVASLVKMMISLSSVYSPATKKWSPSFGLKLKGSFFWFHSKYPYRMTTHLFWMISTNILLLSNSSILPLITMLNLLWCPHFIYVNSLHSSLSRSSSLICSYLCYYM